MQSYGTIVFLAGAASSHTIRWANAISSAGYEVFLLTLHPPIEPLAGNVHCEIAPFAAPHGYVLNRAWVRKRLSEINPDIVHVHYAAGYGLLGALSAFHPLIVSVWGSDVYLAPHKSFIHRKIIEFNLSKADIILSTSHAMAEKTKEFTDKHIVVTPFGIDTRVFKPLEVESIFPPTSIVIGTIKTLGAIYGIDFLIKAFAILCEKHPDLPLKLLIVGGGKLESELRALADELQVSDKTVFTGYQPHEKVPQFQNMLDVSVTPSNQESFGVAVLEASACGKPVVVSNVGGLPEVVEDGVTGIVVPRGDPEAIAEAVSKLLADPQLRQRMGQAGLQRVKQHYDWNVNVRQMCDIYQDVIKQNRLSA